MATVVNPDAGPDEPLRVRLDDEAPPAEEAQPASAAVAEPPAQAVGIKDLERQLAESARQREEQAEAIRRAQQERDYAVAVATEAQNRGITADEVVNQTNLNAAQGQLASLTEAQKTAYETGDWGKVAEANAQMARLGGYISSLEQHGQRLQQQREQFVARQQQTAEQQRAAAAEGPRDPFERALAGRTARTQDFLRSHRDLVRADGSLKRVAIEAHEKALDEGLKVDTDEYFRRIEEQISSNGAVPAEAPRTRAVRDTPPVRKSAPMSAAPVSRSIPQHVGGTEYVLTPRLRELAVEQLGPGNEAEWFQNYVASVRAGKMDPIEG
jgi:hypothetical protein